MVKIISQKLVEKALTETIRLLADYESVVNTITYQKLGQKTNYEPLIDTLNDAVARAENVRKILTTHNVKIENLDSLLNTFVQASICYLRIVEGLSAKANATGSYGFFKYQGDIKKHATLHHALQAERAALGDSIEAKDEDIVVTALILSSYSSKIIENDITVARSVYDKFGDGQGHVYAYRLLENGEASDSIVSKDAWDSLNHLMA